MPEKIVQVQHRHGDQKKGAPALVLEVGKPLPGFYQEGRPAGVTVSYIVDGNPVSCGLSDGDVILIGKSHVVAFKRA